MERILIGELSTHVGETVVINGWVDVARDQGKMAFFDFRDRSGKVQGVVFGKPEVLEVAKTLKPEFVIAITGVVNARPEKMRKEGVPNGDLELEITDINILNEAEALPFDMAGELNLDTLLDNRPLTLKRVREMAIFKIQSEIVNAYGTFLRSQGFTEFHDFAEKISPLGNADAESCADYCIAMFSDLTRMVTMQNLFHDGGYSYTGVSMEVLMNGK